ncbi:MAG TPA: hypothetical protein VNI83_16050 [Vicinamibacterales bacterium]|nr:hypothetical protein [Vicinamibacterales bacterium]
MARSVRSSSTARLESNAHQQLPFDDPPARSRREERKAALFGACVERARATRGDRHPWLCTAFEHPSLSDAIETLTPLAAWGIFNPFGPSLLTLGLAARPETAEQLIYLQLAHPMLPNAYVFGVAPPDALERRSVLVDALRVLFAEQEPREPRLLCCLPTLVLVPPDGLTPEELEELFALAAAVSGQDLERTCRALEQFRNDPWGRAWEEVREALDVVAGLAPARSRPTEARANQFRRWWRLVTDPAHVQSELAAIRQAWSRSVEFFLQTAKSRPQLHPVAAELRVH